MDIVRVWYAYIRVSTPQQQLERQRTTITRTGTPVSKWYEDEYTGTKMERPSWQRLLKQVRKDIDAGRPVGIIFDEVSRMARNAAEGFECYEQLYNAGVQLVFVKDPHCNTEKYREALARQEAIAQAGAALDGRMKGAAEKLMGNMLSALHDFMLDLVREDVYRAFEEAQHEVEYLRQRTREGMAAVKARNARIEAGEEDGELRQIGQQAGRKLNVKKAATSKEAMLKHCLDFGGSLTDAEVMAMLHISKPTFYKYKREIREEYGFPAPRAGVFGNA